MRGYKSLPKALVPKCDRGRFANGTWYFKIWNADHEKRQARLLHRAYLQQLRDEAHARAVDAANSVPMEWECWPYGQHTELTNQVNTMVPKGLPEVMRADVCQSVTLCLLEGQTPDVPTIIRHSWIQGMFTLSTDDLITVGRL